MPTPISALLDRKGSAVYAASPQWNVADTVAEMNRHRIGSLIVLEHGRIVGIFTERDVLRRVVGAGLDPHRTRLSDVMSTAVLTISPDTTIEEATAVFTARRCRHLPVTQGARLIGVISIGDVTRWMAEEHRTEAEHLKNYIAGSVSA